MRTFTRSAITVHPQQPTSSHEEPGSIRAAKRMLSDEQACKAGRFACCLPFLVLHGGL